VNAAAISRSSDHRYTYAGETYPGVTGILRVLDKSDALMAWAARNTAEAALELMDKKDLNGQSVLQATIEAVGSDGVVKMLTSRSSWKRDEAANLGTQVHELADLVVKSEPTPPMSEAVRGRVLAYVDWWKASGWTLRLSEALVVNPTEGYGGTFDLLARDRDGRTVLADIKTGKAIYHEAVLQLAAYGMATYVAPMGSEVAYPMPAPDRYVILHVTLDGVREVEISIGDLERSAFLACSYLAAWRETIKGKRL
jgi:hypothetical protein